MLYAVHATISQTLINKLTPTAYILIVFPDKINDDTEGKFLYQTNLKNSSDVCDALEFTKCVTQKSIEIGKIT